MPSGSLFLCRGLITQRRTQPQAQADQGSRARDVDTELGPWDGPVTVGRLVHHEFVVGGADLGDVAEGAVRAATSHTLSWPIRDTPSSLPDLHCWMSPIASNVMQPGSDNGGRVMDSLPVPIRTDAGRPAVRTSSPVHTAGSLTFDHDHPGREVLWNRLHERVRDMISAKAGELLDWWASERDGRVSVVALGRQALVTATPTQKSAGGFATEVVSIGLDWTTHQTARVNGAPASPAKVDGAAGPAVPLGALNADLTGALGHLPARAQELLQQPFLNASAPVLYDYFYLRTGHERGLGGATLQLWCYLTDKREVTFASGIGRGYHPDRGVTQWELTCWRAACTPAGRRP